MVEAGEGIEGFGEVEGAEIGEVVVGEGERALEGL